MRLPPVVDPSTTVLLTSIFHGTAVSCFVMAFTFVCSRACLALQLLQVLQAPQGTFKGLRGA
jgi:hypothetical protein